MYIEQEKIGTLNGEDLYLGSDGLAIKKDHQYLVEVTGEDILEAIRMARLGQLGVTNMALIDGLTGEQLQSALIAGEAEEADRLSDIGKETGRDYDIS